MGPRQRRQPDLPWLNSGRVIRHRNQDARRNAGLLSTIRPCARVPASSASTIRIWVVEPLRHIEAADAYVQYAQRQVLQMSEVSVSRALPQAEATRILNSRFARRNLTSSPWLRSSLNGSARYGADAPHPLPRSLIRRQVPPHAAPATSAIRRYHEHREGQSATEATFVGPINQSLLHQSQRGGAPPPGVD